MVQTAFHPVIKQKNKKEIMMYNNTYTYTAFNVLEHDFPSQETRVLNLPLNMIKR